MNLESALIVDSGMWDLLETMRGMLRKFGADDLARTIPNVTDDMLAPVMNVIENNPSLQWTIVQREFWAHGVDNLVQYSRKLQMAVTHQYQHRAVLTLNLSGKVLCLPAP